MSYTPELEWSEEAPVTMVAGKGTYAIIAAKGTMARLRSMPQAIELTSADEAALLAPLG